MKNSFKNFKRISPRRKWRYILYHIWQYSKSTIWLNMNGNPSSFFMYLWNMRLHLSKIIVTNNALYPLLHFLYVFKLKQVSDDFLWNKYKNIFYTLSKITITNVFEKQKITNINTKFCQLIIRIGLYLYKNISDFYFLIKNNHIYLFF